MVKCKYCSENAVAYFKTHPVCKKCFNEKTNKKIPEIKRVTSSLKYLGKTK